ncbi:MAG: Rpn family recombination-promoting nuclease/putative transposase [Oscillospiraceae bacterium]|nr:Rpn family recombination-promoting nuclease/putative transposase [Oscillospiraceae bacterium]
MPAERNPEMGKVVGLQKELSMDEQVQMMVEAREKARRDHEARIRFAENEGMARGEARGIIRGAERNKREMARTMLNDRMSIDLVAKYSGLSLADIQALQQQ